MRTTSLMYLVIWITIFALGAVKGDFTVVAISTLGLQYTLNRL